MVSLSGKWQSSIPAEISQLMSFPIDFDWDWQLREVDGDEWFVARLLVENKPYKIIAGRVMAEVEDPPHE